MLLETSFATDTAAINDYKIYNQYHFWGTEYIVDLISYVLVDTNDSIFRTIRQ